MKKLFNEFVLADFINGYRKALEDKIDHLQLNMEFTIFPIELKKPVSTEPLETIKQIKNIWDEKIKKKFYKIIIKIPFEGTRELLFCYPIKSDPFDSYKGISVHENLVYATMVSEFSGKSFYTYEVNRIISVLLANLSAIHIEINSWNSGLEELILKNLKNKKDINTPI
jgi:hypothetical protein